MRYREFWITDHTDNSGFSVDTKPNPKAKGACNYIHVIDAEEFRDHHIKMKAVIEYCYDHLDKMWAAKICGILLGCDFKDAKEHAKLFFEFAEEEGL